MTSREQVKAILEATRILDKKKDMIYEQLMGELEPQGIRIINFNRLSGEEGELLETYFDQEIAPYLSANIVSKQQPFPFLKNKEIYAVALLATKSKKTKVAIIPCSNGKGSSSTSNKEKDVKLTTTQQKAYNKIDIAMNKLRKELANPKNEEDTVATPDESNALIELNAAIKEAESKGEFDQETIDEFWKMAWPLAVSYQRKYKYAPNFNQ